MKKKIIPKNNSKNKNFNENNFFLTCTAILLVSKRWLYKNLIYSKNLKLSFIWLLLTKIQNIHVPDDAEPWFKIINGFLILSLVGLISFITLFNTIFILQGRSHKNKLNLEERFKNYPIILRIIHYYEK